jgi:hypothetical protein
MTKFRWQIVAVLAVVVALAGGWYVIPHWLQETSLNGHWQADGPRPVLDLMLFEHGDHEVWGTGSVLSEVTKARLPISAHGRRNGKQMALHLVSSRDRMWTVELALIRGETFTGTLNQDEGGARPVQLRRRIGD